jgi:hypothetical protein
MSQLAGCGRHLAPVAGSCTSGADRSKVPRSESRAAGLRGLEPYPGPGVVVGRFVAALNTTLW